MQSTFHNTELLKRRQTVLLKKAVLYTQKIEALKKKNNYTESESSLLVANDTKYQNAIKKSLIPFMGVKHVVLVGIGGSNLGTEAVYQALKTPTSPSLLVLDSIDGDTLAQYEKLIAKVRDPKDIALVVISKSGTTTETLVNAQKALEVFEKKYAEHAYSRIIFIGDKDTPFMRVGKKKKILCIPMPTIIGGRYSVFTAVGIVPLRLLGIDVDSLRKGATTAIESASLTQSAESAVALALYAENGVHTVNFFTFNKRLALCGYWYRQLLAESIGKNKTTKGTPFSYPLLPVVSTSADLHSMSELYLGGYKNMYTHFLSFDEGSTYHTAQAHWLLMHTPFLADTAHDSAKDAITKGVLQAYDDQKLPYRYTTLDGCTPYEIGHLLASLMVEVMCLAHIFDIDAFHQPSVELYKKHTRTLLTQ